MKKLGILFLILGGIALVYALTTVFTGGNLDRGDNLPFLKSGPMVISVISLIAGAALLLMHRNNKKH